MENTQVTEIVVYTVKRAEDLKPMQALLDEIIDGFEGYEGRQTLAHPTDPLTYADIVRWQTLDAAKAAEKAFHAHPKAEELSRFYGETKFFSQFKSLNN